MIRYAKKVDSNHGQVRDDLRRAGYDVLDCSRFGGGLSDLIVRSPLLFVEVKAGTKRARARVHDTQKEFRAFMGDRYLIASTANEVIAVAKARVFAVPMPDELRALLADDGVKGTVF